MYIVYGLGNVYLLSEQVCMSVQHYQELMRAEGPKERPTENYVFGR